MDWNGREEERAYIQQVPSAAQQQQHQTVKHQLHHIRWPLSVTQTVLLALLVLSPLLQAHNVQIGQRLKHHVLSQPLHHDPRRWYLQAKFYNRCSKGFIQSYERQVNARGMVHSPLVDFILVPSGVGRLRLFNRVFGTYICFNRRRRITTRVNGRSARCVFTERLAANHYTELHSVWQPNLLLGFNHKGRFQAPGRLREKRHCFQYVKFDAHAVDMWSDAQHWQLYNTYSPYSTYSTYSTTAPTTTTSTAAAYHRAADKLFAEAVFSRLRVTQAARPQAPPVRTTRLIDNNNNNNNNNNTPKQSLVKLPKFGPVQNSSIHYDVV